MVLTGRLWPLHLKPLDGELLSSWLTRLARAHHLRPYTFCKMTWPGRSVWNRDIDRLADDSLLVILSEKTATPLERVRQTILRQYDGLLYESHSDHGHCSWIMPIGIYHQSRRRFGLQYCPLCLREDAEPYFRCHWRLALSTCCLHHRCMLRDRCPKCDAPIQFHRCSLEKPLWRCPICDGSLLEVSPFQSSSVDRVCHIQSRLFAILEQGWTEIRNAGPVYSFLFFEAFRQILKILARKKATRYRGQVLAQEILPISQPAPEGKKEVETMEVGWRLALMLAAEPLIQGWPERFAETCKEEGILSSELFRDMNHGIPYWYYHVCQEHLYHPSYHPTDKEVVAAIKFLEAKGLYGTPTDVARLLGVTSIFRKRELGDAV